MPPPDVVAEVSNQVGTVHAAARLPSKICEDFCIISEVPLCSEAQLCHGITELNRAEPCTYVHDEGLLIRKLIMDAESCVPSQTGGFTRGRLIAPRTTLCPREVEDSGQG